MRRIAETTYRRSCAARCRRRTTSRRGAVAVEFAAVAPVLLAVVVGMLELSRVYTVQNTLETAAREGRPVRLARPHRHAARRARRPTRS